MGVVVAVVVPVVDVVGVVVGDEVTVLVAEVVGVAEALGVGAILDEEVDKVGRLLLAFLGDVDLLVDELAALP